MPKNSKEQHMDKIDTARRLISGARETFRIIGHIADSAVRIFDEANRAADNIASNNDTKGSLEHRSYRANNVITLDSEDDLDLLLSGIDEELELDKKASTVKKKVVKNAGKGSAQTEGKRSDRKKKSAGPKKKAAGPFREIQDQIFEDDT